MRSLTLVASVALLALAFAGCADDPERYPDGVPATSTTSSSASATQSPTASSSSSTSTGPVPPANSPPTGSIAVSVNGTAASFNLTGTDADDDALSWILDFGDGNATNGTSLPASVRHPYNGTANFTAVYTLTDGTSTVSYRANLTIGGGAAPTTQTFSGSMAAANNAGCGGGPYDAVPMTEGVTYLVLAVDAGTWGQPFLASFASGAAQDYVLFLDSAGATLLEVMVGLPGSSWDATGTVPADSATAVFFGCLGTPGEDVVYTAGPVVV